MQVSNWEPLDLPHTCQGSHSGTNYSNYTDVALLDPLKENFGQIMTTPLAAHTQTINHTLFHIRLY